MRGGGRFALPRLASGARVDDTSFFREAAARLGFYEPGQRPSVVDPTWTGNRAAQATVVHEEIHQSLSINTHHGVLTQLLIMLAPDVHAPASLRACLDEQWSVQELAATYAELAFVRRAMPGEYDAAVRGLPTAMLDQPPYRELYDRAEELLPVDAAVPAEERATRYLLVIALAGCAMQTGCLRALVDSPFNDESFADYLRQESPHRRFEEIVTAIGARDLQALARDAAAGYAGRAAEQDDIRIITQFVSEIARRAPAVPVEAAATLALQGQIASEAVTALRSEGRVEVRHGGQGQRPEFVDSPEKQQRVRELISFDAIEPGTLDTWLQRCEQLAGGVHLVLQSVGRERTPFAAVAILPSDSPAQLDDLRGAIDPRQLLLALGPYPEAPLAITFLAAAWREWYGLFSQLPRNSWVHTRLMRAVRICAHRRLSNELVAELLDFENLKDGAGVFVMQVSPELFVGCFSSPTNEGTYALQKIPSRAALDEFGKIVGALGMPWIDPDQVAHLELLERIVRREFVDPQDLRPNDARS